MLSALWKTGSAYYSNLWVWKWVWFSKVGVVMEKIRPRFARTDFPPKLHFLDETLVIIMERLSTLYAQEQGRIYYGSTQFERTPLCGSTYPTSSINDSQRLSG